MDSCCWFGAAAAAVASLFLWRQISWPATHRTIVAPLIVNSSKGIVSPLISANQSHKNAGGHGVLHCTEACGIKGVKSIAMMSDPKKMRAAEGFTRRHRRHVIAMIKMPRKVQRPDARISLIMGSIEWWMLAAPLTFDSRDFQTFHSAHAAPIVCSNVEDVSAAAQALFSETAQRRKLLRNSTFNGSRSILIASCLHPKTDLSFAQVPAGPTTIAQRFNAGTYSKNRQVPRDGRTFQGTLVCCFPRHLNFPPSKRQPLAGLLLPWVPHPPKPLPRSGWQTSHGLVASEKNHPPIPKSKAASGP